MNPETFLKIENTLFTAVMLLYFAAMIFYFIFVIMKKQKMAAFANILLLAGFVLHTAALITRGIGAGRLPMTNQYEFATSFAWGLNLVSLIFIRRFSFHHQGDFVSRFRQCGQRMADIDRYAGFAVIERNTTI